MTIQHGNQHQQQQLKKREENKMGNEIKSMHRENRGWMVLKFEKCWMAMGNLKRNKGKNENENMKDY